MQNRGLKFLVLGCIALPIGMLVWSSQPSRRALVVLPAKLDFGDVTPADDTGLLLSLANSSDFPAQVQLAADCSCIRMASTVLTIEPRQTSTVRVNLNRFRGDIRDGVHTQLTQQIEVTSVVDGQLTHTIIPVAASFYEPYLFDDRAASISGLATELEEMKLPITAAADGVGRPRLGTIPPFVSAIRIDWNDEFRAGNLLIDIRADSAPGRLKGEIELHQEDAGADEVNPGRAFVIPIDVYITPPCRVSPRVILLGGMTDVESETVRLEPHDGIACSILSASASSTAIELESVDALTLLVRKTSSLEPGDVQVANIDLTIEIRGSEKRLIYTETLPVQITGGLAQSE